MKIKSFYHLTILLITSLFFLSSCGALSYKRADIKDYPINDADKRKKNMKDGRGITFGGGGKKKSGGKFDFASSNEMWRAAIDVLDFVPLLNADYGGGIIITDWYSENQEVDESIKISVQFLSNEIRSDALKVKIYNKKCSKTQNCVTSKISSELNSEIKLAILKKASKIQKTSKEKSDNPW
jgi:hypothetical protein